MKANENQRGVYLLALGLLVAAIALAGGWSIWGGTDAASNVAVAPSPVATQQAQVEVETGAVIEPQTTPEADAQKEEQEEESDEESVHRRILSG